MGGWRRMITYLESEAMVDQQMVVPAVEEVAEPVVEAEEEQVIAPVVDIVEGQMDAPLMDMEEDLAVLFGDDDFEDDASDGFGEEEVRGPSTAVAEGPSFPPVAPGLPVPPCMIEDLSTRLDNLEYGHEQLAVDRVEQVGVQVELGQQTSTQRDETITGLTQQVQALQGEHADAVHFGIGEMDYSLREKTTRTPVVLLIFPFDF
ncbi:hypothetical protein Tco_0598936 [Tanacetum coccineum]